ncbi:endonuclease Q family protein [Paenibacillus sp. GCM10027626]|uniref:endonuclease Q family protein n=1 Tax=Paenibacillus sp. GCM10027626 TaxID=3273411 RepID=UPI003643F5FB
MPAQLRRIFADLHLHIGSTSSGDSVKISASRNLTFRNIAHEAAHRKGISLLGVIDCHSPGVQRDIAELLDCGEMEETQGGGIRYRETTILLGAEIEVKDAGFGLAHHLVYLPTFAAICDFTKWISRYMRNVQLSSQRIYVPARELQQEVCGRGGLFIPAHIFTPHKSLFGSCSDRLADTLDPERVHAVELGLSADTAMACRLGDLARYPYLSNSDAHSLSKIGREYNEFAMKEPSFAELELVLRSSGGRGIVANYGLNPLLGKYHRTRCLACDALAEEGPEVAVCRKCGSSKLVRGVMDRIEQLAGSYSVADKRRDEQRQAARPPYHYQVPLEFLPGVGRKTLEKLLQRFGTEMAILHDAGFAAIADTAGVAVAEAIMAVRAGTIELQAGGGGRYGHVRRAAAARG